MLIILKMLDDLKYLARQSEILCFWDDQKRILVCIFTACCVAEFVDGGAKTQGMSFVR